MLKKILLSQIILFQVLFIGCSDDDLTLLDEKKMFVKPTSNYIGGSVKDLILGSRKSLKYYSYIESNAPFYLKGITLTFTNNVKIQVELDKLKYVNKKNLEKRWNINKCLLENIKSMKVLQMDTIKYKYIHKDILIEYISYDSILIHSSDSLCSKIRQ